MNTTSTNFHQRKNLWNHPGKVAFGEFQDELPKSAGIFHKPAVYLAHINKSSFAVNVNLTYPRVAAPTWELTLPCHVVPTTAPYFSGVLMQIWRMAVAVVATFVFTMTQPVSATSDEIRVKTSKQSDVSVFYKKDGDIEYVVGKIVIAHPPDKIWPVLANPFEFEQTISPRFKTTKVVMDRPDLTVMQCKVDMGFLPPIKYTVESKYENNRRITFRSTEGDLKDFRGMWEVEPSDGGKESVVTYSMYVQPGVPVPQWIVRQAIKSELPHTLIGLRDRVTEICSKKGLPAAIRHLAATGQVAAVEVPLIR